MAIHLFGVGQTVEFVSGRFDSHVPRGHYTVTRQLPGPAEGREYRVKHVKDGHERVVPESQLRATAPGVFG